MKYLAGLVVTGLLSGCSVFFDDRAQGYLVVEEYPPVELPESANGLVIQDAYVIPEKVDVAVLPEEFEVPRPAPLLAEEDTESSASLLEYQSDDLNPVLEQDGAGTYILRMDGRFAQAWTAVSEAIPEAGYSLTDLNRSTGTYYLVIARTVKDAESSSLWDWLFGPDEKQIQQPYLLKMNRARSGVYLSLQQDLDVLAEPALTQQVLSDIQKTLRK